MPERVVPTEQVRVTDRRVIDTFVEMMRTLDESGFGGTITVHLYPEMFQDDRGVDLSATVSIPRSALLQAMEEYKKK